MKKMVAWLAAAMVLGAGAVSAQTALPQFQVDPFWPKTLPNNWLLGQVSGIATDRYDRIWVVHRPGSLTPRERAAEQNPPEAKCCVAAPPVLVFDQSGNLVRHWGGPGAGYQWPESEHGVFIDGNDFVWLAGNGKKDGQLLKFTMDGKFVLQIGKQGQGSSSAIPSTASASTRTGWSMSAIAPMTGCRSSARMAASSPSTSTRRARAAPARSTISCSRPTRSRNSST
jgi:hypothetical protein